MALAMAAKHKTITGAIFRAFAAPKSSSTSSILGEASSAGLLSPTAPNYITLITRHLLVGIGVGDGPVLLAWFLEFVRAPRRGPRMITFQGFWTAGTVVEVGSA